MSIPNRDDLSHSSSNHSIVSIQSIRSITPISRVPQIYNQQQPTTSIIHPPSNPLQSSSIFTYHQTSMTSAPQINIANNPSFPMVNFNENTATHNVNNNTNPIQNTSIPSIPSIPTLPPIRIPLPLPLLHTNTLNNNTTHTNNAPVNQSINATHSNADHHNTNNQHNDYNTIHHSDHTPPIKLRQNSCSHLRPTAKTTTNLPLLRKRKRKRRKKRKTDSENMYFYQLERACGLEIEEASNANDAEGHNQAPSPRFAHCSCIHGEYLYVWGGRNQTRTFYPVDNELYRYHLPSKRWTKIKAKLNPLYKQRDTQHGSNPQPRYKPFAVTGATAIVYKHCIYIFGGYHSRYTNQLLKYDIHHNYWSVVEARGNIPQRRWEYSATVYKDKMYIFGGTLDRTHFNDLYSFDFEECRWTELRPVNSANSPRPRRRHKAVVYKHKMYIFGGREEPPVIRDQLPQDLQIYDFRSATWSRISCADSSSSISIPIALNHSLYVDRAQGLLYVFGCQDAPVVTYDFKLNRWYPVSSRNYERHGLSLCTTHHGNVGYWGGSLYIFGGQSRDKVVQGQLLKFSLNPQPQYTRDMLSMLDNKGLSDIQFRISSDQSMVYAHKFMLMARCEYFNKMFSGNFAESKDTDCVITIDNCSKKVFLAVLRYFYTDELWNPTNVNDTLEMLNLADLYQFKIMRSHCCKILEKSIKISNAILLLQASRKFNLLNLKLLCKDFIMANFHIYQNRLGLMTDLIELIQMHSMKHNNDKQEKDDANTQENEWKALHNEIMDAMGKLFGSNDNRILTERQKRLRVDLTQKDMDEYRQTHKDMMFAAQHGAMWHSKRKKNKDEITTLDDNEKEEDGDEEEESDDDDESEDDLDEERPPAKRQRLCSNDAYVYQNNNDNINPRAGNQLFGVNATNANSPNFVDESMDREHLPYLVADVNHRNHN